MPLEAPWEPGASPGRAFCMETGGGEVPGSGLELKPQEFSGVITMRTSCVRSGPTPTARPQMGPELDVRV